MNDDDAAYEALVAAPRSAARLAETRRPCPSRRSCGPCRTRPRCASTDWACATRTTSTRMLRKFRSSRVAVLRAAGWHILAQQVDARDAVERMLQAAVESELPIMCFVGNRGMVQIRTGPVRNLRRTGPWFNVLDERFNLHLNTGAVSETCRSSTSRRWTAGSPRWNCTRPAARADRAVLRRASPASPSWPHGAT